MRLMVMLFVIEIGTSRGIYKSIRSIIIELIPQKLIYPLPPDPAFGVGQAADTKSVAGSSLITGAGIHIPELMSQQTVEFGACIIPLQ